MHATDTRGHLESTTITPFARLALAHAVGMAGDVFVTVSLAGTLFFDVGVGAARPKVLLYLVLTMAPFAVVAPVLGPFLDRTRGGRRLMVAGAMAGRAVICMLMASQVNSPLLYPLAFGALVLSKGQSIAKSALVPAVVDSHDELVLANSRLAIISVVGASVAAPIAAAILKLAGAEWVLRTGSLVFVVGTICAFGIPRAKQVGPSETVDEREALHARSIVIAGTAMGVLRAVVGFFTFFAAFALKRSHEPAWVFGLVLGASALGNGLGTVIAPFIRKKVREEWMLAGALLVPALPLVLAARAYGRVSLVVAAATVAAATACGRVAFDSLLQRDGSEAVRGRAFARFETRFQLVWVAGGVAAVVFPGGGRGGIFVVAVVLLFAGLSYVGGFRRTAARNTQPSLPPPG
ncbi:MAG: Major Facilitator Superfamily transporter [Actinomycetia bacterium]|jgi:MFS family permease|nr:Major Facilitator Superfamily transporter [Actinomycetes bacterium]